MKGDVFVGGARTSRDRVRVQMPVGGVHYPDRRAVAPYAVWNSIQCVQIDIVACLPRFGADAVRIKLTNADCI